VGKLLHRGEHAGAQFGGALEAGVGHAFFQPLQAKLMFSAAAALDQSFGLRRRAAARKPERHGWSE